MANRVLEFIITDAGLAATFDETNTGAKVTWSHIALGSGLAGKSYVPSGTETALRGEFMRRAIGGGERIASNEILLQCLFSGVETGVIREVGLFTSTGVLWALWSGPAIGEKYADVDYVFAQSIVVEGIDLDRLSWVAGGANVNILVAGPLALLGAEIARMQRRIVESEIARLTPPLTIYWS